METEDSAAVTDHEGVTVLRNDRNVLVARKTVRERDRDRLRHELATLQRLEGLAVVAPLDPHATGEDGRVDLLYVGPRTLADASDLPPGRLLAVLASVAHTLADAHDRGVSHGRIEAGHVLLAEPDGAVLCGWSEAGIRQAVNRLARPDQEPDAPSPATDGPQPAHGQPSAHRFDPPADVAAVGELALQAAQHSRAANGRFRTQLSAVATAARHPDPAVRPPMRELARILDVHADPALRSDRSTPSSASPWRTRRLAIAAAAATASAVVTVVLFAPGGRSDTSRAPVEPPSSDPTTDLTPASPPGASATSTTTPQRVAESTVTTDAAPVDRPCPATHEELALAGLPATCSLTVSINAEQMAVGELRYALGDPGDRAGLVDPTCSGRLTPALVQTASGRVYLYDEWAGAEQPSTGRFIGQVAGAVGFADPLGGACGNISLVTGDGSVVRLPQ